MRRARHRRTPASPPPAARARLRAANVGPDSNATGQPGSVAAATSASATPPGPSPLAHSTSGRGNHPASAARAPAVAAAGTTTSSTSHVARSPRSAVARIAGSSTTPGKRGATPVAAIAATVAASRAHSITGPAATATCASAHPHAPAPMTPTGPDTVNLPLPATWLPGSRGQEAQREHHRAQLHGQARHRPPRTGRSRPAGRVIGFEARRI